MHIFQPSTCKLPIKQSQSSYLIIATDGRIVLTIHETTQDGAFDESHFAAAE